ncbi:uncharacterized protein TEOVI_000301800 [Trypanosoma equiperdum]|uniref:Uncharacterized protein n=2 Tax=Trypanozoon TaxID=39700 RepID=Q384N0_TRYB2|nr:hypothetical protein, conserved [Trypanosoma brucei brucei TREU927]EAN79751.1 hypothetical protein, conserved [Trypanosoma brucei brucei TREU927]SCU71437.1 hypothetical protein, conserved [Trypanosoma equiperdum]
MELNQLELFVASTEHTRSDAWRYLRRLRVLDCKIEEGFDRLHEIAVQLSGTDSDGNLVDNQGNGTLQPDRKKRGRPPLCKNAFTATPYNVGQSPDSSVLLVDPAVANLHEEFRKHSRSVKRYALEREQIAEELVASGKELTEYLEARMREFRATFSISD